MVLCTANSVSGCLENVIERYMLGYTSETELGPLPTITF